MVSLLRSIVHVMKGFEHQMFVFLASLWWFMVMVAAWKGLGGSNQWHGACMQQYGLVVEKLDVNVCMV